MWKKLILLAGIMMLLCGCSDMKDMPIQNESELEETLTIQADTEETMEENTEWTIMEGMRYLPDFAEEQGYYCMGLTGREERGKGVLPPGIETGEDNELNLVVECLVRDMDRRKMAVQILVDYVQVPFIVDGERYDTYYIESEDDISILKKIYLDTDIDRSVDHKITVLLINDLQVHTSDSEHEIIMASAQFDAFLFCDEKKDRLMRLQTEYEVPIGVYEDEFPGLFLTQDDSGSRKKTPGNLIYAKPGETVSLYYHLGGFIQSDEAVVFVDVGERQTKINGKDYLLFHETDPNQILYGKLELTAPMEEGKYEICAWALNNPYGEIEYSMQDLYIAPRITLSVEK